MRFHIPVFLLCTITPLAMGQGVSPGTYQPITGEERFKWVALSTVGQASLGAGLVSAGWGTLFNLPKEYGPHWEGFGKRYGSRLAAVSAGNTLEAGIGSFWGEDPRYVRAGAAPFKSRAGQIIKMTFAARNREGKLLPAYARYIASPANNFLSNTWRPDSEATAQRATLRIGVDFLGRLASNAFAEFWPDIQQRLFHRNSNASGIQDPQKH